MNTIKKSSFPLRSPDLINNNHKKPIIFDLNYFLHNPIIFIKDKRVNVSLDPILRIELRRKRHDVIVKLMNQLKVLKKLKVLPANVVCVTFKLSNNNDIMHEFYMRRMS